MPLDFTCPACGRKLQVPDAMSGQRGACTFCHTRIVAPRASGEPATLAPPESAPLAPPNPAPRMPEPPPRQPAPPMASMPGLEVSWAPPGVPAPASFGRHNLPFAPFWKRAVGFVVDTVALWVLFSLLKPLFNAVNPWPVPDMFSLLDTLRAAQAGTLDPNAVQSTLDPTRALLGTVFSLLWTSTIHWFYFAGFESSSLQATPGKLAVGAKVTDMRGDRIGFGRASVREMGKGFSSMICFVGYLMAAFTERHQALHDFLAQTLVLDR